MTFDSAPGSTERRVPLRSAKEATLPIAGLGDLELCRRGGQKSRRRWLCALHSPPTAQGGEAGEQLYVVNRAGPGKYEATFWKALPGAPRASGVLPDGRLFVSCVGGDVVIDAGGRMKMASAGP